MSQVLFGSIHLNKLLRPIKCPVDMPIHGVSCRALLDEVSVITLARHAGARLLINVLNDIERSLIFLFEFLFALGRFYLVL